MTLKKYPYEQTKEMFFSTLPLSLLIFVSVLFLFKLARRRLTKSKSKTNLNLPPYPPKLPFIGNLHQLGTLPHRSLRNLSKKHGNMMMMQLGQMQNPALVVSSSRVAREIMKTHDLVFSNRPQNTAVMILLYGGSDIGFAHYGESWRQKRKICVLHLLSNKRVQSFRAIREEHAAELVKKLREASSCGARSVNLSEMLVSTVNNVVCTCALGRKYDKEGGIQQLARKVMIYLTAFTVRDYFPSLGWVDVVAGKIRAYKETFGALDALFDKVIEEHKVARLEGGSDKVHNKDLVDILLQLREDGLVDFELTDYDFKAILMDMFVAGTDTASAILEWGMTELMKNPRVMKKAQEEVRRVVGHKLEVEESDISQMNYLKCVIKETLRLHPPTTIIPFRKTMSSVKLNGYDIPPETIVLINAWAIQREPEFWESPEEFMPERFQNSEIDFVGQDSDFIPFGFGRRGCPGMMFGIANVECVLANLLYWFDWKLPQTCSSVEDIDMSEAYGLVVSKKVPLCLKPISFPF